MIWYNLLDLDPRHAITGVYCVRHNQSGKEYIGQSSNIYKRLLEHIGKHRANTYLHRALATYGPEAFSYAILLEGNNSKSDIREEEKRLIAARGSLAPMGYNLTEGGEGTIGYRHTELTKERLRQQRLGKALSLEHKRNISKASLGKVITEECRKKISKANTGRLTSSATREKLRVANTGRQLTSDHIEKLRVTSSGRRHTAETKDKLSKMKTGVTRLDMLGNLPGNSIEVLVWTSESTLPRVFKTAKAAAAYLGISYDTVRRHITDTYRGVKLPVAICEA
jgi:group I intron endonuclease